MKVIRQSDYSLIGSSELGFIFRSNRFDDEHLIAKSVKYIAITGEILFLVSEPTVSVSLGRSVGGRSSTSAYQTLKQVRELAQEQVLKAM